MIRLGQQAGPSGSRTLKDDAHIVAVGITASDRIAPIDDLNHTLARLSCSPQLDAGNGLVLSAANPQTQIRLALATAAIQACELPPQRVRQCANRDCVLLFRDTTKNGTRRWHDMATCGNREKAASHYRRHKRRH
jgi:predicted RNA-binding Zn ribbon-like protein